MFSIIYKAGSQSLAPFLDCTVNHSLIKTVPLLLDTLAQLFHVLDLVPTNAILQNPHTHNQLDFDRDCWVNTVSVE